MAIDLRVLRNYVSVASIGSISRAAQTLHIAQPALSLQIKRLEEAVGVELLERHPRGVILTDAGRRFLTHAIDILRRVDVAFDDVRSAVRDPSGTVAVGMPQSLAQLIAVPLVTGVISRWPKVHLQLVEMSSAYVAEEVLRGRIDIGMTFGIDEDARLHYHHLLDEELALYAPPGMVEKQCGDKAALAQGIALSDLSGLPLILPTPAHSLRKRISEYLESEDVTLHVIAEVNTVPRLIELVENDVAATILSVASVEPGRVGKPLHAIRIVKPIMTRAVYACKLATAPLSQAASAVQALLFETVDRLVSEGNWPRSSAEN